MNVMNDIMKVVETCVDEKKKNIFQSISDQTYAEDIEAIKKDAAAEVLKTIFYNEGYVSDEQYTFKNLVGARKLSLADEIITSPQFKELFPRTVTKIILESVEPNLTLSSLLTNMKWDGMSARVPTVSTFGGDLDVPEGAQPQSFTVSTGGYKQVTVGKSGIMVEITDETIKYSNYALVTYLIEQAGIALARHKERKTADMIDKYSHTIPGFTLSGVNKDGTQNSTLTFDDLLAAFMELIAIGGIADTIIMNPLAFTAIMQNPSLKSLFLLSQGNSGSQYGFEYGNFARTTEESLAWYKQRSKHGVKGLNFPSGIFGKGFSIILSEFVPIDKTNKTTTVYVADSTQIGFLVTEQEPVTEQFSDPLKDIKQFKIIEKYGIVPKSEGKYMLKIPGVKLEKGYDPSMVFRTKAV